MLVTEKKLSKKLLKRANLVLQKGTKENKISLGSWLAVWEANEICTFISAELQVPRLERMLI